MADPKPQDLRAMPVAELQQQLVSLRTELGDLKLRLAHGTVEHPWRIRSVKRQIARVQTILRLAAIAQDRGERAQRASRTTILHEQATKPD